MISENKKRQLDNLNQRKSEALGMPFGTANNRLRKAILFHLLKTYDLDVCFQCGKKIENIEELSIEHKIPWLNGDATLFWDIENIAFSHLKCNVPTVLSGEDNPNCKLSDNDVSTIRTKLNDGAGINETAREYGICRKTVQQIRDNTHRAGTP